MKLDLAALKAMPKVELHRHLEGSIRPETLWEYHCCQGLQQHKSFETLKAAYTIPPNASPGYREFLARFAAIRFKWGGPDELERVAAEVVADAANDGIVHLELRFSPTAAARRLKHVPPQKNAAVSDTLEEVEAAAEVIIHAAQRQAQLRRISVALVVTLGRDFGVDAQRPAAALLTRPIASQIAGLDLAGDEASAAEPFAEIFAAWRAAGKGITVHAGEDPAGPGALGIRQAIEMFGAERIGHGLRAVEDEVLLADLAQRGLALELCPTSNLQTGACRNLDDYPARALLKAGIPVTLNADDPAMCQTTLSYEYWRGLSECRLSAADLRLCALNAARTAFLPESQRSTLIDRIDAAWSKLS